MNVLPGFSAIDGSAAEVFRIRFAHRTVYRYSGPVEFRRHRLVLRPRESHFERLERFRITTSPASTLHWHQDVFGNILAQAVFSERADQLIIESDFVVAKIRSGSVVHSPPVSEGLEYPVMYAGIEDAAVSLYRSPVYPPEVEELRRWVRSHDLLPSAGARGPIFERMAQAVHQRVVYQRREEPGVQSPSETLQRRSGSCRDTALLLMEAARSLGYAARFVSGYLESDDSRAARGSTHAWTEVYCPDRGWLGFDPSIGAPVGDGHVAVAVSHHPRGVMPITGSFKTHGHFSQGLTVGITSERIDAVSG